MKYRPEIDGLRAVAVTSVIFYHAGFSILGVNPFQGGFLGVDIFFVISGYLITLILLEQSQNKNINWKEFYLNFYERRARRILPALFLVMFVSIPFAWKYMFPLPFESYAESILASVLFASNFLFWKEGGYGDAPNALKPFLHTWSLSIEEQFYIFFPVFLFLCMQYMRKYLTALMVAGFILSLALAEYTSHKYVSAGFYLIPTRAWELLAGALLARFETQYGRLPIFKDSYFMPLIGLLLIVGSIALFTNATPHPSLLTALPVAGVMMIIYFGGRSDPASWLLSTKPFIGLGLISYSLYLWHQPVFAFARIHAIDALTPQDYAMLGVLTLLLSIISWKFVEQPFRDKTKFSAKQIWLLSLTAAIALVAFGAGGSITKGFPKRFDFSLLSLVDKPLVGELIYDHGKKCHESMVKDACHLGPDDAQKHWIIIGDSHMGYLATSLWETLKQQNAQLTILTRGGCPYAPGLTIGSGSEDHPCPPDMNQQRKEFLTHAPPSTIVIGGRFPFYLTGIPFDNQEGGVELPGDYTFNISAPAGQNVKDTLVAEIKNLVELGHTLVLIYPVPEAGWSPPELYKKMFLQKPSNDFKTWTEAGGFTTSYDVFKERNKEAYEIYDAVGDSPQIIRIYPEHFFCGTTFSDRCITHSKDTFFYADPNHLSVEGNKLVVNDIMKALENNAGAK